MGFDPATRGLMQIGGIAWRRWRPESVMVLSYSGRIVAATFPYCNLDMHAVQRK